MRTDLDHLPANKQRKLERVVEILFEEFGIIQQSLHIVFEVRSGDPCARRNALKLNLSCSPTAGRHALGKSCPVFES